MIMEKEIPYKVVLEVKELEALQTHLFREIKLWFIIQNMCYKDEKQKAI